MPAGLGTPDRLALGARAWRWHVGSASGRPYTVAVGFSLAAALQAIRLAPWCGHRTLAEPLIWVLHLAYAWLPIDLGLLGAAASSARVQANLAVHALTAGAIGAITLAVMTRATLGLTGRALQADAATTAIYIAVTLARLAAAMLPERMLPLLAFAGAGWFAAFGGFAVKCGNHLIRPGAPPRSGLHR